MSRLDSTTTNVDGTPSSAGSFRAAARGNRSRALGSDFPLILALADDDSATAALRMTAELARERGAVPTVVRALGTRRGAEVAPSSLEGTIVEEYLGPNHKAECREGMAKQVQMIAGQVEWRLDVSDHTPVEAIVEQARELRAELIVMGLRRHGVLMRSIARDLLSEVVRVTRVPVLAVRPEFPLLPKRIVVAIDFGEASIRAAHIARQLLADGGAMFLVHASSENSESVRSMIDGIADDLSPAPGMTTTSILLHGDIQSSIEGLAQAVSADLLAMGSEEHSLLDGLATGSLAMRLAHTARCSTLIVPSRRDD